MTPVLILGAARTGTTWLGNILIDQFQCAGPAHPLHHGLKESDLYRSWRYWQEFRSVHEYVGFLETYSTADFFRLTGVDKEDLFRQPPPSDFLEFFLMLMDAYAERQRCDRWVTKLDPTLLVYSAPTKRLIWLLKQRYSDVKLVLLRRDFHAYIVSYLGMPGRKYRLRRAVLGRYLAAMVGAARYNAFLPLMARFSGIFPSRLELSYEDLLKDPGSALQDIGCLLGVPAPSCISTTALPNTSGLPDPRFDWSIRFARVCLASRPQLSRAIIRLYEWIRKGGEPLTWRLVMSSYYPEDLAQELCEEGHDQLLTALQKANTPVT